MEAPPSPFVISTGAQRSGEICGPADLSWECFSTGGVMGLRPTQGDEKRVLFSNYCCWKRRPPLCHLDRSSEGAEWRDLRFQRTFAGNVFRPEESWAFGPPKAMKNGSFSATTVGGSAALPFIISTGAPKERSGEICGPADLSWECFSTGGVMGLRPTQGDEKRALFSNYCCWKRRPPLCHLDRSSKGAEWRDLRSSGPFLGSVFRPEESWAFGPPKVMKNGPCSATTVVGSAALPFVISTGAPKERSGEICGP